MIEIPELPGRSVSLALEICQPKQGIHEVTLTESGEKPYRVTVRARAMTKNGEALILHHLAQPGRVRHYKFLFKIEADNLILQWLDRNGKEHTKIEDAEW